MVVYTVKRSNFLFKLFYYSLNLLLYTISPISSASNYFQTDEIIIENKPTSEDTLKQFITLSEAYWQTDKNKSDSIIQLAFKLISKNNTYNQILLGDAYHMLGKVQINTNAYNSGIGTLKTAINYKTNTNKIDYKSLAKTYNYIGVGFMKINEFDSSIYYCNKSKQILKKHNLFDINLYYAYLNIGINYSKLGSLKYAINYFDTAYIVLKQSKEANNSRILAGFYLNFALFKTLTGQMTEANDNFEKAEALIIDEFGESNIHLAAINNNKGINAYFDYDFSKAALYYKKALDVYISNNSEGNKVALIYSNLSNLSQQSNDYLGSINYCLSGLEYLPDNDFKLILNKNIAQSYDALHNTDKANHYFQITLNLLNKENINPKRQQEVFASYADFLLNTKNSLSLYYYNKALKVAKKLNSDSSDQYAEILSQIGRYYLVNESNADNAMHYFNKSISIFTKNTEENDIANINIINKKEAQIGYAESILLKYKQTQQASLLFEADTIFSQVLNDLDNISNSIGNNDKLLLIEMTNPVFNLAIKSSNALLKLTGDKQYANKIFNFSERSKSSALLSAVNSEHALKTSDIPQEIFAYEHQLKEGISNLQQLLEKEKTNDDPNYVNISFFETELLDLINKYDSLIISIEDNYPKYYSVKYGSTVITPQEVKQNLENDEIILEYQLTDSVLYTISITDDEFIINDVPIDSNFYKSLNYIISIKSVDLSTQNFRKFNEFKYHSNNLWKTLIEPSNGIIGDKRLIVIPDGILGYLPFDLLITHNIQSDSLNYRDLPYLIKSNAISYSYSSTLKYNTYFNSDRKKPKDNILAFAPLYFGNNSNNNDHLPPLPFAKEEAINIVGAHGGNVYYDAEATKSNFLEHAPDNNILHLAMHTIINDSLPMQSKLVFYNDKDDRYSNYMFTHEIYNLNLNAAMVVLSACNSGTGDFKKGEGIMSLARGFVYAGVPSIVMTLWEVQDASGSLIMNNYYEQLSQGTTKDVALQQAKLSALKNANMAKSHPFFWSTYIISGDTSTMVMVNNKDNDYYYWVIAIFILLVTFTYFYKVKKTAKLKHS